MGTPGNRSTEPGLQGLQNRKAARQWAAFFAITLPRQSSTIKKIRKPPYSSGGALGFHRNGPTMRGRALDCCRNRGRAGTNPGTPERPSETGTAALRTGQAITLYFFPAATFIDHPAVSGTPRTPYEGENETYIEASVENSSSILYDKEIRNKPRTRRTKRNV